MTKRWILVIVLLASALQGCSGLPAKADSGFSSVQLFEPGGQPRFTVDLTCAGLTSTDDLQCSTVENAFSTWSAVRHVTLREVDNSDPAVQAGDIATLLRAAPSGKPYLLLIRIEPLVEPSFRQAGNGVPMYGSSGHSGSIGYRAWIRIFSTATGALVGKSSPHHQLSMPDHVDITPAFKAEVYEVIRRIDPAYPG